jgi:hypothetical protein
VHGVVNGALSLAQGGSFIDGFVSGAIGQAAGMFAVNGPLGSIGGNGGATIRSIFAGAAGGAASELTGGKFMNGFVTAAFAQMWNGESGGNIQNLQHDAGVKQAIEQYRSGGWEIWTTGPTAVDVPGFPTPRIYDFIVRNPSDGAFLGVEVKTTRKTSIKLNPDQVQKDVVVMMRGGVITRTGQPIKGVGYAATCFGCMFFDTRSARLESALRSAQIPINRCDTPGDCIRQY